MKNISILCIVSLNIVNMASTPILICIGIQPVFSVETDKLIGKLIMNFRRSRIGMEKNGICLVNRINLKNH